MKKNLLLLPLFAFILLVNHNLSAQNLDGYDILGRRYGSNMRLYGLNISYLLPTNSIKNPLDNTWRFSLLLNGFNSKSTSLGSI